MQGSYFAKHLKTNGIGDLVENMANSQSTRAQVANTVIFPKAAGEVVEDAKKEAVWKVAEANAFEHADRDKDENRETEE